MAIVVRCDLSSDVDMSKYSNVHDYSCDGWNSKEISSMELCSLLVNGMSKGIMSLALVGAIKSA